MCFAITLNNLIITYYNFRSIEQQIHLNNHFENSTEYLEIWPRNNPFICDERMQWIRDGEQDGWLKLKSNLADTINRIYCENFPGVEWNGVDLQKYTSTF